VTVDVVCAGPVFLDLTFEGLEELPEPGRERYARELHQTPGGSGITAVGLTRLGLHAAVVAPLGRDVAGRTLRRFLEAEGVTCAGATTDHTPVTVVLPVARERAFVTYEPPMMLRPSVLERLHPRAAVVCLDQLELLAAELLAYVVVGDRDAERHARSLPRHVGRAQALFANRFEAERLTGEDDPEAAAIRLAEHVPVAVVTCGGDGALAASDGKTFEVPAPAMEVRDTTGAGDLLVAAYVWGDLGGLPLGERLRRAVVYAALSVRAPTGAAGAATLCELQRALAELEPATMQTASAKEDA
jgi:sugar/nucleoside kinase (ribokinase family)